MIERVARVHYFGSEPFDQAVWDGDEYGRKTSIEMAKLEIAAMREPTEAMVDAGFRVGCSYESVKQDFFDAWQAMIGEALRG